MNFELKGSVSLILYLFLCFLILSCDDDDTPAAELITISPTSGPKGTALTIAGLNFGTDTSQVKVLINDRIAEVKAITNTTVTVTVPAKAGTGKVMVTVRGKVLNNQPVFTYQLSVSTLAGSGTAGNQNGTGASAQFNLPSGIAVDDDNIIYVTDYLNYNIRRITPDGVVTTIAGKAGGGYANGAGDSAAFWGPNGVVLDEEGNLYIADEANCSIRRIDSGGIVTTFAGNGTPGFPDGTGSEARFANPSGIAIDQDGNFYVADQFSNRIRKITSAGVVTTLAGSGTQGAINGTGTGATFYRPVGVAVDVAGNIFVADLFNHRIRKVTAAGVVTTVAGSGVPGFADGPGDIAKFQYPAGLAIGPDGLLYVADTENNSIRMVDPTTGAVSTLTGRNEGYHDGAVDHALFRSPREIDISSDGTIYVADAVDNRIRKID